MLCAYKDIRSRIAESPTWFDEYGVPRYCHFTPGHVADIYADEVALVEIACQECGHRMMVAFSSSLIGAICRGLGAEPDGQEPTLADAIRAKAIHYGDPPCFECSAGATMNCIDVRVVSYWRRGDRASERWVRDQSLEITLDDPEDPQFPFVGGENGGK